MAISIVTGYRPQAIGFTTAKGREATAFFRCCFALDANCCCQASVNASDKAREAGTCRQCLKRDHKSDRHDSDDQRVLDYLRAILVFCKGSHGILDCVEKPVHLFHLIKLVVNPDNGRAGVVPIQISMSYRRQASGSTTAKRRATTAFFRCCFDLHASCRRQASVDASDKAREGGTGRQCPKCDHQSDRYDCDDQRIFNHLRAFFVIQKRANRIVEFIEKFVHWDTY